MNMLNHLLIRASAGTGKTFRLSNRFIHLLSKGVPPRAILATTFTRKAAGEIRDRILERLAAAILNEESFFELQTHAGIESHAQLENAFNAVIHNLHSLNIGTLDSFFANWATQLGFEFGLTPGWSIFSSPEYTDAVQNSINDVLRYGKNTDLTRLIMLLNKGISKRSVTLDLQKAVENLRSIHAQSSLESWNGLLYATSMTSEDLDDALQTLEQSSGHEPNSTFKNAILKDIAAFRTKDFEWLIKNGLSSKIIGGQSTYSRKEIPASLVGLYRPLIEYLRQYYSLEIHHQSAATYELLERFETSFWNRKRQRNQLEFSDVTRLASHIQTIPADLNHRLNSDVRHLLLDEFQDTSVEQWNAIEHLVQEVTRQTGGLESSLFCVGDVKQAIYGWRGGRREIFNTLSSSVEHLNSDHMEKSWRSSDEVLNFVNDVFGNLTSHPRLAELRPTLAEWSDEFQTHESALEIPGYVEYRNSDAGANKGERLSNALVETVSQVGELIKQNKEMTIGVLVRQNDEISRLIQLLNENGIPASEEGGNPLTRFYPVQLIMTWLQLLEHPGDVKAIFRINRSPLASRLNPDAGSPSMSSSAYTREWDLLLEKGLGGYLRIIADALRSYLNQTQHFRVEQLVEFADGYSASDPIRLKEFIAAVEIERFAEESDACVRVMTIHQSKGLEFDAVILPTLENKLTRTPDLAVKRSKETQLPANVFAYRSQEIQTLLKDPYRSACQETLYEQAQEAMCVLYVALTRAAHALYLIGPCATKPPKQPPVSVAALIQFAISGDYNEEPSTIIYSAGSPDWYQRLPDKQLHVDDRPSFAPKLGRTNIEGNSSYATASPSSMEGGDLFHSSALFRPENAGALNFGTLVHSAFEHVEWWNSSSTADMLTALSNKRIDFQDSMSTLLNSIDNTHCVATTLSQAFYSSLANFKQTDEIRVFNELPVTAVIGGQLIRGYVDRIVLGILDGRVVSADIVDFKTDNLGKQNEDLPAKVKHYEPQLMAYRETISQMFKIPIETVSARLLFVSANEHHAF